MNPRTGTTEIVREVLSETSVLTEQDNVIETRVPAVGDTFVHRVYDDEDPEVYTDYNVTVTAIHLNETTGLADGFVAESDEETPTDFTFALVSNATESEIIDNDGTGGGPIEIDIPSTNQNVVYVKQVGRNGGDGVDGWGIRICIFGCFTIGRNSSAGSAGYTGPTIDQPVGAGHGNITTVDPDLPGITAISIGGRGGQGGDSVAGINISGAQGGAGGVGGDVDVDSSVEITTTGERAHGIFALSRAGQGGAGGRGYAWAAGGTGGVAGQGGPATVTNSGTITTYGLGASGMLVQSMGGVGGAGGDSYGIVGVAGSSSPGGHGGRVEAYNEGTIDTTGIGAHGIVAQSIGGDGGDAGVAAGLAAIGGDGNTGGNGGVVVVENRDPEGDRRGLIVTRGSDAYGILAQSIGGGGGNGSSAYGIGGIGGTGAGGGSGADVTVTNAGTIQTVTPESTGSHAIVAQSIGGGGGTGGSGWGLVGIGGDSDGSETNVGGVVTVVNAASGRLLTSGQGAYGVLAQSIGGGGGAGAGSGGLVSIGGDSAAGGAGGEVRVTNDGTITTLGVDGKGIVAQSIGGGGGAAYGSGGGIAIGGAGGAGGSASAVTVTNSGAITTGSEGTSGSDGVLAQSIGGGGGAGGSTAGLVSIGGDGTAGGVGNLVTVTNSGTISTTGAWSRGVHAQSIGGGGGSGGDSLLGDLVSIGGNGDVGASADDVTVSNAGAITTHGNLSSAIEAQSIGGGGGSGGSALGTFLTIGGTGDGGGAAGDVTLNNGGRLFTAGNDSHGMFAQSIGGGGGNGGNSTSASAFFGVAIGGPGAGGGAGQAVTINSLAGSGSIPTIQTEGDRSKGILAQSIGGGGGNGGFAAQTTVGYTASVSVAIGGSGGAGANGGTVTVNGDTAIETTGVDSDGILAQSIGGGGGNGGFAVSFSGAFGETAGISLGVGVGGEGGSAGEGGDVILDGGGSIHTTGLQSEGLIAQSVGGGGGTGGFSVTTSVAGGGVAGVALGVGVGGSGGDGGNSGTVDATWHGDVTTEGADANAIVLQGVGGGGGNGGFNVSAAVAASGTATAGVAVGVGGSGGLGGEGGIVDANITGDITTLGARSAGLVAQSIGGRGGNGGFNITGTLAASGGASGAVAVGVGGAGGGGGNANEVTATYTGTATTAREDADAVMFQSVGGGGGNGGFNIGGAVTASTGGSLGVSVGVGGAGGGAGDGALVTATAIGDLTTSGARSNAFVAQSLGGGGGNGGINIAGTLSASTGATGAITVGVGGSGGGGGNGGVVIATQTGDATTHGEDATAVIAQSLGGGGGNGGLNVSGTLSAGLGMSGTVGVGIGGSGGDGGFGDATTLVSAGDVATYGDGAGGILAQSVGGGGGTGGVNVTAGGSLALQGSGSVGVGVGGSGGLGGESRLVTATHTGTITTSGDHASAFTVQSIGGGGGSGGTNVSGGFSGSLSGSGALSIGVGGSGGGGGIGGAVTGNLLGDASTAGIDSTAVLFQSVGGGGGSGGVNVSGAVNLSKDLGGALAIGIGGSGGDGKESSAVTGTVTGTVTTTGDGSTGVLAQSVGGGGGKGGVNVSSTLSMSLDSSAAVSIGVGGFGGLGGDGDVVSLTRTGTTTTDGANSDGIIVQSLGGGGGNGGVNVAGAVSFSPTKDAVAVSIGVGGFGGGAGDGKDVTATVIGDVLATGADDPTYRVEDGIVVREIRNGSNGIVAQSLGGAGGNGATNVSGGIALEAGPGKSMALNVGVGGFGGGGGDAGVVTLQVDANQVTAVGDNRSGVIAQSIGGGGGNGGVNVSAGIVLNGQITVGVGGFGGSGGVGKDVNATANTNISATGAGSIGFLAQSVGGGGGNGGINVSGGIRPNPRDSESASSLVFGLGGFAGDGNTSGDVTAHQAGDIAVEGEGAIGVLAQSIAGGGGTGGLNVSGNLSAGKGYAASIGIGGTGGAGATAGSVTLVSDGTIIVDGGLSAPAGSELSAEERAALEFRERANGILAQSIGGGGGNGGMNITGAATTKGSPLVVGVGGTGGTGRDAGTVSVTRGLNLPSVLVTSGNGANGITAQSIGGGGGNAGANLAFEARTDGKSSGQQLLVVVGGGGGEPGHGKLVEVTHVGTIVTDGRQSDGIVAQSIGGGGGNANINLGYAYAQGASGINVAVGGAPGAGGDGGKVTVDHTGTIVTAGDNSSAIYAQSVGGGGGDAQANSTTTYETTASMEVGIGRRGGTGGKGGDVEVTSSGDLRTAGNRAVAVFAQSVGNGGGESGAFALGFEGEFKDKGKEKEASAALQVGLEGGQGGTAGNVTVETAGTIMTAGKDSHAIQAQSVGGGGGVGGGASSHISTDTLGFNLGVGGTGGEGAVSGTVDVTNHAALSTSGEGAHGIFAQSVGGGGGTGGKAGINEFTTPEKLGTMDTQTSSLLNVSVGGTGGTGATGNLVTVANAGTIHTLGSKAYGINAQSLGGGGGTGGAVVDETLTIGKTTRSLTIDVGGMGGLGAAGKDVTVTNTGTIHTEGADAIGIRAQSLGGGGGDGGLVLNMRASAISAARSSTVATINIGGAGGTGGVGGDVRVTNARADDGTGGVIVTEGDKAYGIHAQSIGGGGGNGSSIIAANLGSGMSSTQVGVNIGGAGGTGATAGDVEVTNSGDIETFGDEAHGIYAQSIGGGGGNGGLALAVNAVVGAGSSDRTPLVALGGFGGDGGDAGDVRVENTGSIVIHGDRSVGIYAQTQSGGGGGAGIGIGLTSGATTTRIAGALSAIAGGAGAFGVHGGAAGAVGTARIEQHGNIVVLGRNSSATRVENVNGGGGHITLDFDSITSFDPADLIPDIISDLIDIGSELFKTSGVTARATGSPGTAPAFEFRAGGDRVRAMSSGDVELDYQGSFALVGDDGAASSAQAVGGGGGAIDLNLGIVDNGSGRNQLFTVSGALGGLDGRGNDGGAIHSVQAGDLLADGDNALGLLLQSVGGGGGRVNVHVAADAGTFGNARYALGGTGGSHEAGGAVLHEQQGAIVTRGDASHGAVVQSIGGGGGALTALLETAPLTAAAAPSAPVPTTSVRLGSSGGSALEGGAIDVELAGDVATDGRSAVGLVLQSIGAGGGSATAIGSPSLGVTVGGTAGASGDGAAISLAHAGSIHTSGARSHGVVVQSIGGGGGAVFTDVERPDIILSAANSGSGGAIRLEQDGDVVTLGDGSIGLLVQSLGGGGGYVDGALAGSAGGQGRGGAITAHIDGSVVTLGQGSTALFLQSAGSQGGGDISASLAAGHLVIGGAGGTAVVIDGGSSNTFTNDGAVATLSAATGRAFSGGSGADMILNHGIVQGSVDLGGGANGFRNFAGAQFLPGVTVNLGSAAGLLEQHGLLAPAGEGLAVATHLDGSLLQTAGARSDFELDLTSGVLDSVLASGTVDVAGALDVSLINAGGVRPGTFSTVLYAGEQGLTDSGLSVATQPSVVVSYEVTRPDARTLALDYDVNFAPAGLAGNRNAIGAYMNRLQAAGGATALEPTVAALVLESDLAAYGDELTQLGPEFYAEQEVYTLQSAQAFSQAMQDCGSLFQGPARATKNGCIWMRFDYETSNRDADAGFPATEQTTRRLAQGVQKALDDGWSAGFGLDVEDNDSNGYDGAWQGEATVVAIGLVGRREVGGTSIGGVLTFGSSDQDVQRRISVTEPAVATGDRDVSFMTAVVDVGYPVVLGGLNLTPAVDLGLATLWGGTTREAGAGAQNLAVDDDTDSFWWIEPSVLLDAERQLGATTLLQAFARIGALYYFDSDAAEVAANFAVAPAPTPMHVYSDLDDWHFLVEGGLALLATDRYTLTLSYTYDYSELRDRGAATVRVTIPLD